MGLVFIFGLAMMIRTSHHIKRLIQQALQSLVLFSINAFILLLEKHVTYITNFGVTTSGIDELNIIFLFSTRLVNLKYIKSRYINKSEPFKKEGKKKKNRKKIYKLIKVNKYFLHHHTIMFVILLKVKSKTLSSLKYKPFKVMFENKFRAFDTKITPLYDFTIITYLINVYVFTCVTLHQR